MFTVYAWIIVNGMTRGSKIGQAEDIEGAHKHVYELTANNCFYNIVYKGKTIEEGRVNIK